MNPILAHSRDERVQQVETGLRLRANARRTLRKPPELFALIGVSLCVFGVVVIATSFMATMATVQLFGMLLLIGGIAQIIDIRSSRDVGAAELRLLAGALYAVVGGLILLDLVSGAIDVTLLLAAFLLVVGITRLLIFTHLTGNWRNWVMAGGVIDMMLGVMIWLQWPIAGIWMIGVFVGTELLLCGARILCRSCFIGGPQRLDLIHGCHFRDDGDSVPDSRSGH